VLLPSQEHEQEQDSSLLAIWAYLSLTPSLMLFFLT
jgi:hypothetical protein